MHPVFFGGNDGFSGSGIALISRRWANMALGLPFFAFPAAPAFVTLAKVTRPIGGGSLRS